MGSIASSVAGGLSLGDEVSTFALVILMSGILLVLLGTAYVIGTINDERSRQHKILLSSAAIPLFVTFLSIMIRQSLPFILDSPP